MDTADLASKAMEGGSVSWIIVTALGALCTLLFIVVGFFIKKSFNDRERKDGLLERRLSSGSETMQKMKEEFHEALESIRDSFKDSVVVLTASMTEIKNTIMTIQSNDIKNTVEVAKMLPKKDFDEFKLRHQKEHDEMNKSISDLRDAIREVSDDLRSSVMEMKGCVLAVKDLTAKIVNKEFGK